MQDEISISCYKNALLKIEEWLEGDNDIIRQNITTLLADLQIDLKEQLAELKTERKAAVESGQSEMKRLLDVLVRDPRKLIL